MEKKPLEIENDKSATDVPSLMAVAKHMQNKINVGDELKCTDKKKKAKAKAKPKSKPEIAKKPSSKNIGDKRSKESFQIQFEQKAFTLERNSKYNSKQIQEWMQQMQVSSILHPILLVWQGL